MVCRRRGDGLAMTRKQRLTVLFNLITMAATGVAIAAFFFFALSEPMIP